MIKPLLILLPALFSCTSNPPIAPAPKLVEKIVYVPIPLTLQLPTKPKLSTITSHEVKCLSKGTKQKIIDRDKLRADYIEQLELIITSTETEKE